MSEKSETPRCDLARSGQAGCEYYEVADDFVDLCYQLERENIQLLRIAKCLYSALPRCDVKVGNDKWVELVNGAADELEKLIGITR